MAELMHGKISGAAKAGQAIMGQGTRPHQFTHGIIVMRVFDSNAAFGDDSAKKRFCDGIGQLIVHRIEISIQGVHHNVSDAAGNLINRKRVSQLRIHDGKSGTVQIRAEAPFASGGSTGEDCGVAGLAASRRDGEDGSGWEGMSGGRLAAPEIPDIGGGVGSADGNSLGRVDDGSASHPKKKVSLEFQSGTNPLFGMFQCGIGLYPAEFLTGESGIGQNLADLS